MSLYVNIQKKLGDTLLKVEFELNEATLGILGASGAGKSITLKCIAGIECPDSGQIIYNNRTLFDSDKGINVPIRERKIGYLFQSYALFPHMTVKENILCGLAQGENNEDKLSVLLDTFQIRDIKELYPRQLSGGQKQRVALARMMGADPDLILLDEPFSALDPHLKCTLQDEVEKLLKPFDKTIVVVSHDLNEIKKMCQWTMLIHKGINTQPRPTGEVINKPQTLQEAKIVAGRNIIRVIKQSSYILHIPEWQLTITKEMDNRNAIYGAIEPYHLQLTDASNPNSFKANGVEIREKPFSYEIRTSAPKVQLEVAKETWRHYSHKDEIYVTFESQYMMLMNE